VSGRALLLLSVADLPPGYVAWVRVGRTEEGEITAEIDTDVYDGLGVVELGLAAERRLLEEIEPCDGERWIGPGSPPASGGASAAGARGTRRTGR